MTAPELANTAPAPLTASRLDFDAKPLDSSRVGVSDVEKSETSGKGVAKAPETHLIPKNNLALVFSGTCEGLQKSQGG